MKNQKPFVILAVALFIVLGVVAVLSVLFRQHIPSAEGKLPVTASFYPIAYFSQEIGGTKVHVTNITPAGAEPHDYEPTAKDIAQIEASRLLVLNGVVEPWGERIKQSIDPNYTHIVVASAGLTSQKVEEDGLYTTDPHVWLSPPLAEKMVDAIAAGFTRVDPARASTYNQNAAALKSRLAALDATYRRGLANCQKKAFITSHAAFGYVASTYRLTQVPIAGLSPDAEPSPGQLAKIVTFAKARGVHYIFFESLVSPKLSETIAREVGAKTLVLNPLEGLTAGQRAQGENYFTQMRQNLTNLELALQCTP